MSYSPIYTKILLNNKVLLNYSELNDNMENVFKRKIKATIEGKCIEEGYIKHDSVNILSYSSAELQSSNAICDVVYECMVANPVESMILNCKVKSITKVGIRAEINDPDSRDNPFVVFVARDHHYDNESFASIEVDGMIDVRVIGKRYELYDPFISVIAELKDKHELINPTNIVVGGKSKGGNKGKERKK